MNNKTLLTVCVIVSLIIGGVIGYTMNGGNAGPSAIDAKKLQDSIAMMKDQAGSIKSMAEMMRANGAMMQELGMKYKDDQLTNGGKDLGIIADKYLKAANATSSSMMDQMMK